MTIEIKDGVQATLSTILEGENPSSYRDAPISLCGVDANERLSGGLFICKETKSEAAIAAVEQAAGNGARHAVLSRSVEEETKGKLPETKKDGLLRRFLSFATKNAKARECLANHPLPPLSEEEILSLIDALPLPCPIEKEGLARQLKERIDYLNYAFSIAGIPVEEE